MDRLLSMRAFCTVAATGHFSKAAIELGLNSAVVSRLIADLEADLKVRLLHRTTRNTKLTEVGQAYLERCRHILDEIDDAKALVSGGSEYPSGHLRMLVSFSEGLKFLTPHWQIFRQRYPDVTVEVILLERPVDLVNEQFDIAIQPKTFVFSNDVVIRNLMRAKVILCASPDYLQQHGTPANPHDLEKHDCISFADGDLRQSWTLMGSGINATVKPRCVFRSNNIEALFGSIRTGMGIGPAFEWVVAEDLKSGKLLRVFPELYLRELDYYIVYPTRKYVAAKTRAMIDFLQEVFETESCLMNQAVILR